MSKSFFLIILLFINCKSDSSEHVKQRILGQNSYKYVEEIPLPTGYKRVIPDSNSFGQWLRKIKLKKDNHVYLYNGLLKRNQSAQFVVLDISVGKKDLQQCADAVMRLRAEYLFNTKKYDEILFIDNKGKKYQWQGGGDKIRFEKYLENVFGWCNSASLEKQLHSVGDLHQMELGDVFIKGGFPGHAMLVIDMAENSKGEKIYLLAQSYMPAQDIHIVKNPGNERLSPWYKAENSKEVITPEYRFYSNQLRKW